jgi:hypothetical protein
MVSSLRDILRPGIKRHRKTRIELKQRRFQRVDALLISRSDFWWTTWTSRERHYCVKKKSQQNEHLKPPPSRTQQTSTKHINQSPRAKGWATCFTRLPSFIIRTRAGEHVPTKRYVPFLGHWCTVQQYLDTNVKVISTGTYYATTLPWSERSVMDR